MKRFKSIKYRNKNKIFFVMFFIIVFDIIIFNVFGDNLSNNISKIAKVKIEEISKYYINGVIKKYLNIDTSSYIKLNIVNNNIMSVDIDNTESNKLLKNIIDDLENNIKNIERGKINNYSNLEFMYGNNGVILLVPLGVGFNNSLLYNIGPKIPIKVSFLENVDAYIDVEVEEYGLNNVLVKLFVNIKIEQVIEMPVDKDRTNIEYQFLISSKLINGKIPEFYGYDLNTKSNIVNSDVN